MAVTTNAPRKTDLHGIDIPPTQTQRELARAILDAVGFDYSGLPEYDICAVALGVVCARPDLDVER